MNVVLSLSLPRVNSEFAIRFPISENVSIMRNFPVVHHFGKLTVNEGFVPCKWSCKHEKEPLFRKFYLRGGPLLY